MEAHGDGIKVKLNAPAVDGKANKALLGYLADQLDLKKNRLKIIRGEFSRNKVIELPGSTLPDTISDLLKSIQGADNG